MSILDFPAVNQKTAIITEKMLQFSIILVIITRFETPVHKCSNGATYMLGMLKLMSPPNPIKNQIATPELSCLMKSVVLLLNRVSCEQEISLYQF